MTCMRPYVHACPINELNGRSYDLTHLPCQVSPLVHRGTEIGRVCTRDNRRFWPRRGWGGLRTSPGAAEPWNPSKLDPRNTLAHMVHPSSPTHTLGLLSTTSPVRHMTRPPTPYLLSPFPPTQHLLSPHSIALHSIASLMGSNGNNVYRWPVAISLLLAPSRLRMMVADCVRGRCIRVWGWRRRVRSACDGGWITTRNRGFGESNILRRELNLVLSVQTSLARVKNNILDEE
jgi:hypothetical protein